jgi:pimeloyl-ACP methyl ester carboxylesterase
MPVQNLHTANSFDGTVIGFAARGKLGSPNLKILCACGHGPDPAFDPMIAAMSRTGPVVVVDQRGTGTSSVPKSRSDYSVPAYAHDISAVISASEATRAAIVAYSHAAQAAVHQAFTRPEQVSSLVLIEPALFVDSDMLMERVKLVEQGHPEEALRLTFEYANPGTPAAQLEAGIKSVLENYGDSGESLAAEWRARAMYKVTDDLLRQISVPTLVIGGTHSNILDQVKRVAAVIPNASVFWVRGGTHFITAAQSKRIGRIISTFLDTD